MCIKFFLNFYITFLNIISHIAVEKITHDKNQILTLASSHSLFKIQCLIFRLARQVMRISGFLGKNFKAQPLRLKQTSKPYKLPVSQPNRQQYARTYILFSRYSLQ